MKEYVREEVILDVETRLNRLERRTVWMRRLLVLLILGLGATGAVAARSLLHEWRARRAPQAPQFVRAERFMLVDVEGRERAVLGIGSAGEVLLEMSDAQGNARARLDVQPTGPGLTLFDARGKVRALLAEHADGPFLGLTNEQGDDIFQAPEP